MRKIPPELENPIDNVLIDLGEFLSEYFRALNLTANDLTTISFVTGMFAVYLFAYEKYALSAIFYMISYTFDCFDGGYARKYNMTSKFGDYYDHISDYIINGAMIFLISRKFLELGNDNPKKYVPLLMIPLSILMLIHFGCQEKYSNSNSNKKKNGGLISYLRFICPTNKKTEIEKHLRFSRFFGSATFVLAMCSLILLSGSVDEDLKV